MRSTAARASGGGGHLYVGFGTGPTKSNSVGVKAGFSRGEDDGLLALTDVDGDDLPDKVYKNGGISYRKNLSKPGGEPRFAAQAKPLGNLPGIMSGQSDTLTLGVEGYLGGVAAQLDYVSTTSTTDRYFTDVNGDGITDLVNGGGVLFGRVGPDGVPVYGLAADTPAPIGSAQVDPNGLLGDFAAERDRRNDSFPLVDSVRRWVAPFDGTVAVTGATKLLPADPGARFAHPDGVRVAVQHENSELWAQTIPANDFAAHPDRRRHDRGDARSAAVLPGRLPRRRHRRPGLLGPGGQLRRRARHDRCERPDDAPLPGLPRLHPRRP